MAPSSAPPRASRTQVIKKHIAAGATLELRAFVAAEEEKKRGAEIVMNLDQVSAQATDHSSRTPSTRPPSPAQSSRSGRCPKNCDVQVGQCLQGALVVL